MTSVQIGIASIGVICVLIYGGMHIAVALALCSLLGVWAINGHFAVAAKLLGLAAADSIANYDLTVIPLFVLMGLLVGKADVARDCFRSANHLLRNITGGVAVATVLGNAVMAAVTGVTVASVAIFTKLAVPEMRRLGYTARFAAGLVAGSGVLGMLIPPSLLIIMYCLVTEVSVGRMFIAAVVPGLLLTLMLCGGAMLIAWKWPAFAGRPRRDDGADAVSASEILRSLVPVGFLVLLIFGGLYGGVFTATEAAGVGTTGALVIAALRRRLNWRMLKEVLLETGLATSAVCILVIAANMYGRMITLSGIPGAFGEWLAHAQLSTLGLIVCYIGLLLVLGCFLDSISIILLTVPLLLATFNAYHIDLVWIGLITVVAIEMGLLTPPLGINVFVVKGCINDPTVTLNDVFAGSFPFLMIMGALLALMVAFPAITLGLH